MLHARVWALFFGAWMAAAGCGGDDTSTDADMPDDRADDVGDEMDAVDRPDGDGCDSGDDCPSSCDVDGTECDTDGDDTTREICVEGTCGASTCGDGFTDPGADEECDDGNDVSGDGCEPSCALVACEFDEECDDGNACDGEDTCDPTERRCAAATAPPEGTACDADNDDTTRDVCFEGTCARSECGDHLVDILGGELCDDGNDVSGDGCEPSCTLSCTTSTDCDDGATCSGVETCDTDASLCVPGTPLDDGTECDADGDDGTRDVCRVATCVPSTCGDGFADLAVEACDDGNDVEGDGCDSDCTLSCAADDECDDGLGCTDDACDVDAHRCVATRTLSGTLCRASAGPCDLAESCDGASDECPSDVRADAATLCRASAGACDQAESCDGTSALCPTDTFTTGMCRASTGPCDIAETCDGASAACPADGFAGTSTVCRAAADLCDQAETCDGTAPTCPSDGYRSAGATCRADAGECDVAETCTGGSAACPTDAFDPTGTSCTAGSCNGLGSCTSGCVPGAPCSTGNPCERGTTSCTTGSPVCTAAGPAMAGTSCRASAGPCDLAEVCDGVSTTCPANGFSTATCRVSAGVCDVAESCTGSSAACPADTLLSTGTCRASAGPCDLAETCNGASAACPGDSFASAATTCRASGGPCDVAESCTGSAAACPADGFLGAATTCRASAGVCDAAETCTGSSAACPGDGFLSAATGCRPSAGLCDAAETCSGSAAACPADGFLNGSTTCRMSAGPCDSAEACTGSSANCPANGFLGGSTTCRMSAGVCDSAETCSGSVATCPADSFLSAATSCRASAGVCDVAESCTGSAAACPSDAFASASTTCRTSAGVCDVAESCTGSAAACPSDAFASASTTCRTSAGVCDVAESCTGSAAACPSDAFASASTTCRMSAGACDAAENCSGVAATCPSDVFFGPSTTCRGAAGVCDAAEVCSGSAATCPADGFLGPGSVCRASASACDLGEVCSGASTSCPADVMRTPDPASLVGTSSDDGTPLTVCMVAGSSNRFLAYTDLRDTTGIPISGAAVTIGGVAATESAAQPGVYYREVSAAGSAMTRSLNVIASACGSMALLTSTISVQDVAANATGGGTGGCSKTDGNVRVRVVAAETGAAIAGASVLIGLAEGTPFQHAPDGVFGGTATNTSNVATTDASGYATFYDYGATLAGPVTATASAANRAHFTVIGSNASDLVLALPLSNPAIATSRYSANTGTFTGGLPTDCNSMDAGLMLPNLTLEQVSAFQSQSLFQTYECYASGNGNVGTIPVPQNLWVPSQSIGFLCLGGSIAQHQWAIELPTTASTGIVENIDALGLSASVTSVQNILTTGGNLADILQVASYQRIGFSLAETVPTAPLTGRAPALNENFTGNTFTISFTGASLPPNADVLGITAADYDDNNGIGRVFPLGTKVRAFTSGATSVAIPNSNLDAAGTPTPIQRFAAIEALYLDPLNAGHATVPANRIHGISTVLVRGLDGAPPFTTTSASTTVTDFLDIAATTFTAPSTFRWEDASANSNTPLFSMHELGIRTQRYLPVLSCDTENDIRESFAVEWIVMRPFDPSCSGGDECFTLPTLPASFPRATSASQKRSGFTAYVGSGASCAGTCPGAGEVCVDPDGVPGPLTTMCMAGSGTAGAPYRVENYRWKSHVYDLELAPSFDFDAFRFADRRLYMTHESSNETAFQ